MAKNPDEKVATIGPPPLNRRILLKFTPEYTHVNAFNCALLSVLAYGEETHVAEFFRQVANTYQRVFVYDKKKEVRSSPFFGEEKPFVFGEGDFYSSGLVTQFYIASNADQVIVAVRGTESTPDWIADANAKLVPFPEGPVDPADPNKALTHVHRGFYDAFLFVKGKIDQYIVDHGCSNKEFIVTGHSMGGAVATLVAAYLKEKKKSKVMLYTYGSPRVGDRTFAQYFNPGYLWHHRIVNGGDVVTLVPMPGMDINLYLLPLIGTGLAPTILPLQIDYSGDPYTHCGELHHIEASSSIAPDGGVRQTTSANMGRTATLSNLDPSLLLPPVLLNNIINKVATSAIEHKSPNYVALLERALLLDATSYLAAPTPEHVKVDALIAMLRQEVSVLEASRLNLLHEASLQIQPKKSQLEYQAANLDYVIKCKNVDLVQYSGAAKVYHDMVNHKQQFLEWLLGRNTTSNPKLEEEIEWHARH